MSGSDSELLSGSDEPEKEATCCGCLWNWPCKCCICCLCSCCLIVLAAGGVAAWIWYQIKPPSANLCTLSHQQAFTEGIAELKTSYALSDWKGLDWQKISDDILDGGQLTDVDKLQAALYQLKAHVPDGHIFLGPAGGACGVGGEARMLEAKKARIGGGFGIAISPLDDGSAILSYVSPELQEKGLHVKQKVTHLNGVNIVDAVKELGTDGWLFARINPATAAHRLTEQYRVVTRGPVGTSSKWTFEGGIGGITMDLVATDDNYATWKYTQESMPHGDYYDETPYMTHRTLSNGYGYIGLKALEMSDHKARFAEAVTALQDTPGIIIDLRANFGGNDQIAADFNGFFLQGDKVLYEYTSFPPKFEVRNTIWTNPMSPSYAKPVVVLINRGCMSAGEGVVKGFRDLPRHRSQIVGFEGTSGSFAMAGANIVFPGDLNFEYPYGRALGADKQIVLDSNSELQGGVLPTVQIPRNSTNMIKFIEGQLQGGSPDIELDYAVEVLRQLISSQV